MAVTGGAVGGKGAKSAFKEREVAAAGPAAAAAGASRGVVRIWGQGRRVSPGTQAC